MGSHGERVSVGRRLLRRPPTGKHASPLRPLSVSVGRDMMFCAEGCTAVIDTGSSYITGPASAVSLLMKTIGAQLDESGVRPHPHATRFPHSTPLISLCVAHQYKVSCDSVKALPSLTFHMGGQEYALTQEDYVLWVRDTNAASEPVEAPRWAPAPFSST